MPSKQKIHLLENTAAPYNKTIHGTQVKILGFLRSCPYKVYFPTEPSKD